MKVAAGQTGTDSQGEPGVKEGRWGGGHVFEGERNLILWKRLDRFVPKMTNSVTLRNIP